MKKRSSFILLLTLMLSIFSLSHAQTTVTIGDGTSNNYEPFNVWYGYTSSLALYTSAEIGQSGSITGLGWSVHTTSVTAIPYKIYAKTTTDTELTSISWADFTDAATLLKEGTHSFNTTGWHTFDLDTPFAYAGDNLLIGVEINYGCGGAPTYPKFHCTDGYTDRHQRWRSDSLPTGDGILEALLPDVQITLAALPTNPVLSFRPSALDFDYSKAYTPTLYQDVFVTNCGIGTLDLTAANLSFTGTGSAMYEFDTSVLPLSLASNQTGIIPVRYHPTAAGNHPANLRMSYAGAEHYVALSGIALGQFALFESFEGSTFPPDGWTVHNVDGGNTWIRETYMPRTGVAHTSIQCDPSAHNDWLITPKLAPTSANHTIRFYGRNRGAWHHEQFNVKVSTTDNATASFNHTLATNVDTGMEDYMLHSYDLSAYIGQEVYVAIQAISANQWFLLIDDVSGPDVVMPPSEPVLLSPADGVSLDTRQPTLTWRPSPGGRPNGYKVYCDTNNPPTTEVADVTTTQYTFTTPLQDETLYYWSVKAYNNDGYSTQPEAFSFTSGPYEVITAYPFFDGFETEQQYSRVQEWKQILTPTTSQYWMVSSDYHDGYPRTGSFCAALRDGGDAWLMRPFSLQAGQSYELTIWTRNNSHWKGESGETPAPDPTIVTKQANDRKAIAKAGLSPNANTLSRQAGARAGLSHISEAPSKQSKANDYTLGLYYGAQSTIAGMTNTIVAQTGVTNGDYQRIRANFTPPADGVYWIGIHGVSDWEALCIDDILVRHTPTEPEPIYSPVAIAFDPINANHHTAYQNITVTNDGGGTLNLTAANISIIGTGAAMFEIDQTALPLSLTTDQSDSIPVRYHPSAAGDHTATLRLSYSGSNYDVALNGSAVGEFALLEGFEGETFPPVGWTVHNGGGESTWIRDDFFPRTGVAYTSIRGDQVAHDDWLITPKLVPSDANHTFSFYGTNCSEVQDDRFNVLVSTTDTVISSFTHVLATNVQTGGSSYILHTYDLSAFVGEHIYIAIQAISTDQFRLKIDDVSGPDKAPVPDILANVSYSAANMTGATFVSSQDLFIVPGVDATTPAIAALPNLDAANSHIAGYTGGGSNVSLTFTISEAGTYYLMGYYNNTWNQTTPWPLTVSGPDDPGVVVLSGINFGAKSPVYVVLSKGNDPTLPVTLSHFSATVTAQNFVQLTWTSQTESNLLGYNVYRNDASDLSSAIKISDLIEATNTAIAQTYIYVDEELEQDNTYYYWLQAVDLDGSANYHGPVSVLFSTEGQAGTPPIPLFTKLEDAYPNPFNPCTNIRYQLKTAGKVKIDIYNIRGQLVRSFESLHDSPGYYKIGWDGSDSSGRDLPSGIYLYKMSCGSYHAIKKMILQK